MLNKVRRNLQTQSLSKIKDFGYFPFCSLVFMHAPGVK